MLGFGFASAILTLVVVSILFVNFVGGMDGLVFMSKLNTVRGIVDELYVAEVDWDAAADKASAAIVQSAGDRWSYYMSAEEYAAYMDRSQNSTKGIGVSVRLDEQGRGAYVVSVVPGSPAERAGIKADCVLTVVNGKSLAGFEISEISALIKSQSGEYEILFLNPDGITETAVITNEVVYTSPVSYRMEENSIGYIRIDNFEKGACDDSVAAIEALREQGAESLVFDVRTNPGGQLYELTGLLDYLLPEGEIFVSVSAEGEEEI
ncbi:MAG: PDZ domain-containing protein, partial [Oscillospiraceae bacterium]|nr:PDZ domain-containing protein [Oscillospiraceae bacterium]